MDKYCKWYNNIIDKARHRILNEGTEKHHIIMKCMGGTETVSLTYREHFLCHWLLTKIVPEEYKRKAFLALSSMHRGKHGRITTSWQYTLARKAASNARKNEPRSQETKQKISKTRIVKQVAKGNKNPFYGKTHSNETKELLSYQKTGEKHPFFDKKRPHHSDLMKIVMKDKSKSQKHKDSIAASWHDSRKLVKCSYCGINTTKSMNTRWHESKCKKAKVY